MTKPTMENIEKAAKLYSEKRAVLHESVTALEADIAALKRARLPAIRRQVAAASSAESILRVAIAESPEVFQKPKTRVLHGIKVGFAKAKGKITFADAETVVKLIRKHFPGQADNLIQTKETPFKPGLNQMTAAELKKIGVTVKETTDEVVVSSTDSETDKLISALLAATSDTEEAV